MKRYLYIKTERNKKEGDAFNGYVAYAIDQCVLADSLKFGFDTLVATFSKSHKSILSSNPFYKAYLISI